MRQTLSKGLVVAAAATSALTLYSPWAFADSDPFSTVTDSRAAALSASVPDNNDEADDFPGMASAMRAIEQAQDAVRMAHREARMMEEAAPESEPSPQRSSGGDEGYGDDEPSRKPSRNYGDDEPSHKPSRTHGDDDESSYGSSNSYGDDDKSSYGSSSSYGEDEHCGCEEEKPPPHRHHKPPHKHHKPPHEHVPPPHHKHHHHRHHHHHLAHTGAEGTIGAAAAGAALLAAGTVLYRRGRAASQK
ncbi:LPXTG cell wall anchor domain-containing protein [Streptomyces sp. NPDC001093]|uniref:LPXTG cell wall anchor domain-containing protein n=1 Tax=Streptomyces sp. NPDC001093 TaxID=3154376 RepID=UPI00331D2699